MVCIHCGAETRVINSRLQKRANRVWRRRQCRGCATVFTTEETVQYDQSLMVKGGAGAFKPFSRDKLFLSLYDSCGHRKNALSDAQGLTDTVIGKLHGQVREGAISKSDIIRAAQVALTRFDKAAGVHYGARHRA